MNTKFEAWKIRREILMSGRPFTFYNFGVNDYGEPSGEIVDEVKVNGLYHEENSYVREMIDDVNTYRTKKIPKIMLVADEVGLSLRRGDYVKISGITHRVTGIVDIQLWGVILDVSLEVEHDAENEGRE